MADQPISLLIELPGASAENIDVLPVVDISASETKKITIKDLTSAGLSFINASTIDIAKINQSSATKLSATSLADGAITAAKFANDSSVSTASAVPTSDNFEGRLWISTTDKTIQVYDAAAFTPVKVGASNYIALSVGTAAISGSAITYAKIQDVSATDRLLGRSSSGAGIVEEIACTAAGRALIDDASASDQRTTLGLAIGTNVQAYDPALQSIAGLTTAANQLIYTTASDTYATSTITAAGLALLDDNDVVAQRTTLGLGTVSTQSASNIAITGGSIAGIVDLAIADGGTGASTVENARINLGLGTLATQSGTFSGISSGTNTGDQIITLSGDVSGTGASGFTATIVANAITTTKVNDAAITYAKIQNISATDRLLGRSTASGGTIEEIVCTAAGRALLDDNDAASQRTTLGLGTMAVQAASAVAITGGSATLSGLTSTVSSLGTVSITNGSATLSGLTSSLSSLGTATITGGSITGITDLTVADGGTGASTAENARTNLGLVIGSNVQAYDAGLQSIADLTTLPDQYIYTTSPDVYTVGTITAAGRAILDDADASTQRTTLGLGTIATQASTAVSITGGSIVGITDLAIADGGTGASTAANARTNLGLGTLSTQSGTFSGTSSGTNTGDQTIALTGDVTGTGTGTFAATIADDAVTGAKLADSSATVVSGNAPSGVGAFDGQQWLNTNTGFTYIWDGSAWQRTAGLQTITFSDTTPLTFAVSYPDDFSAVVTSTMENQNPNAVLIGPISGSATTPTFRSLTATDLPIATSSTNGAMQPGSGLNVSGAGVLNHSNAVSAGTYTKVVIDAQGHVSDGAVLSAVDIPNLDASKITTGTFDGSFLAENSVTANQLADNGIAQVSETQPVPEFAGQWWINPSDRAAYIWVGTVSPSVNGYWLNLGFGAATQYNLRFGGTYNATTNLVVSLNQYGTEAGLTIGQPLSPPSTLNLAVYLICVGAGTGTTPAPVASLSIGDWVLSQGTGSNWTKVGVVSGAVSVSDYQVLSDGTYFAPDMTGVADVRGALTLLWGRVQIASTVQAGVVRESAEVLVDNTTGEMTIGTVDEGSY